MALSLAILAFVACHAPGTRPYFTPMAGALIDTLPIAPDEVIVRASQALLARGLEVASLSPEEGYVETRWFDLRSRRSVSNPSNSDDYVKIRFWTDPIDRRRTLVIGEAVRTITLDPSVPPRDREQIVPRGHAGEALLTDLLRSLGS